MLVEKRYPLTPATITDMLNKKLKADNWNEMCYQLLKLITKQLKKSNECVGIKRPLDDLKVTAAKNKIEFEYIHSDGDVFEDYSWERALSISEDVYPEWFLLGLYEEDELKHRFFAIHFTKLEVDNKLFNHDVYWQQIGTPNRTNPRTSLIKEPLIRIVHRLLVGSLVHRVGSKERCQNRDLWLISALDESHGINLDWVIAEHLCKHASCFKKNSLICGGHYVTEIAKLLGYLVDEEVAKCSELIECEKWTAKIMASELEEDIHTLLQTTRLAPPPR
ncbi:hypothetical protein Tco_0455880 [Tanacetum coccineum]